MKILIVQEKQDRLIHIIQFVRCLKDLKERPKLFLATWSPDSWEGSFELHLHGKIKLPEDVNNLVKVLELE